MIVPRTETTTPIAIFVELGRTLCSEGWFAVEDVGCAAGAADDVAAGRELESEIKADVERESVVDIEVVVPGDRAVVLSAVDEAETD